MIQRIPISNIMNKSFILIVSIVLFLISWFLLRGLSLDRLLSFTSPFIRVKYHMIDNADLDRPNLYLNLIKSIPMYLIILSGGWLLFGHKLKNGYFSLEKIIYTKYFPILCGIILAFVCFICQNLISFSQFPIKGFFLSLFYFLILLICSTAPLGVILLKNLSHEFDDVENKFFIFNSGIIFFSVILSILISLRMRLTYSFCVTLLILQYLISFISINKNKNGSGVTTKPVSNDKSIFNLRIPVFISLTLSWGFYLFVTSVPGSDITSQAQIAQWLKSGESVQFIRPFLDSSFLVLRYPPTFSGITAFYSKISEIPINIVSLGFWLLSYPLYTCLIFFFCRFLTKNTILAFMGALLSLNLESLGPYAHNGGQVQEMFANISGIYVMYLILRYKNGCNYLNSFIIAIFLAASILFQTGIAFVFVCTLLIFPFVYSIIKKKLMKQEFFHNYSVLIFSFLMILPWIWPQMSAMILHNKNSNSLFFESRLFSSIPLDRIIGKNFLIMILSFLGTCRLLIYKKEKEEILIICWLLVSICGLSLFGFTSFYKTYGLMASHIIVSIYGLILIREKFKNGKVFRALYVRDSTLIKHIALIFILIIWSVFFLPKLLSFRSNSTALTQSDYEAMDWIKNNSPKQDTLILNAMSRNSPDMRAHNRPRQQWWTGAISERKTVNFKIGLHQTLVYAIEHPEEYDINAGATTALKLNAAYQDLEKEENQRTLFEHGISHILISSRDSPDMIEKANELCRKHGIFQKVFANKETMVLKFSYRERE